MTQANRARTDDFAVSADDFRGFVRGNESCAASRPVVEGCSLVSGSYCRADPQGRSLGDVPGRHCYSESILVVAVEAAFARARVDAAGLLRRGGVYGWCPQGRTGTRRARPQGPGTGDGDR